MLWQACPISSCGADAFLCCRGAKALLVVHQVLQQSSMQELALFSLMAGPKHKQLKIRLDKVRHCCIIFTCHTLQCLSKPTLKCQGMLELCSTSSGW